MLKFRKCHKMSFSYYPLYVGFGVLFFDLCLVVFMSMSLYECLLVCVFYLLFLFFLWVKDVSFEDVSGQYSFQDYRMFRQGFRLFLFSELVLFFTVFWTFLDSSLYPVVWVGGGWCPVGVLSPSYLGLNALASSFLMINSQILKCSRRYLCYNIMLCEVLMVVCIMIGGGFVCFQIFEYGNNSFTFLDSVYGSVFYIGTGLHGGHVLIGVCFLLVNYWRINIFHFNWYHSQAFDMSIDYWRFLEWMWGFMFCLLYVWGS
uniref:cytochrome c oxidase subunit III n=1 Tax=Tetrameres grusi TaxID=1911024 RepID=UPI001FCD97EE|nr:cytochrome c oxidase subunit III [Tetrameres grusi]UNY39749.1 cytochrome c oxidase subunit III [Tetrameres grusi]